MTDNADQEVKKYLTEIKELPNYEGEDKAEDKQKVNRQPQMPPPNPEPVDNAKSIEKSAQQAKQAKKDKTEKSETVEINETRNDARLEEILKDKPRKVRRIVGIPLTTRDILLNLINILTLILLIVIITEIDDKAVELKQIKNENIRLSENYDYNSDQVNEDVQQAERLDKLFITDSGVIDFVSDVENLNESGAIRRVSFSSPDPVKDKSGSFGRPIIIQLRGNWNQIDQAMKNIHDLPYLFRPVRIEIERLSPEEGGPGDAIEVGYGGLLYIKDPENETSK